MRRLNRAEGVFVHASDDRSTRVYFPENLHLRGLRINYLWLVDSDDAPYFSPSGRSVSHAVASASEFNHYLVLVNDSNEIASRIPLAMLADMCKVGDPYFVNEKIDFSKSYIERVGEKTICDYCFVFGVVDNSQKFDYDKNTYEIRYLFENSEVKYNAQQAQSPIRRLYFEDSENFTNRLLNKLYIYKGDGNTTPQGCESVAWDQVKESLITLKDVFGNDIFYNIPLKMFDINYSNDGVAFGFDDCRIDWKKSYIDDYSVTEDDDFDGYKSFYLGLELSK